MRLRRNWRKPQRFRPRHNVTMDDAVILNAGAGSWAFESHARRLSRALGVPMSHAPGRWNYVLSWEEPDFPTSFIPPAAIAFAADKRLMAEVFNQHGVPTPETVLLDSPHGVQHFLAQHPDRQWVLKWPTGCGAAGHCMLVAGSTLPPGWPHPFVVQEFIAMQRPEVYRLYAVAGECFGWNARRFAPEAEPSPWVAHVQGARYEPEGDPPVEAVNATRLALTATGLWTSFGCADLLRAPDGRWLVLEVNTDGPFMHVDRDVPFGIAEEIDQRLGVAFGEWSGK